MLQIVYDSGASAPWYLYVARLCILCLLEASYIFIIIKWHHHKRNLRLNITHIKFLYLENGCRAESVLCQRCGFESLEHVFRHFKDKPTAVRYSYKLVATTSHRRQIEISLSLSLSLQSGHLLCSRFKDFRYDKDTSNCGLISHLHYKFTD